MAYQTSYQKRSSEYPLPRKTPEDSHRRFFTEDSLQQYGSFIRESLIKMAFCLKFNQEAFSKSEEQRTANRAVQELESVGKHPKLLRQTILEYEKQ